MSIPSAVPTVAVPTPDGVIRHSGWVIPEDQQVLAEKPGWVYRAPDVGCRVCGTVRPMVISAVRVVGGIHSMLWILDCYVCGAQVEYPAADNRTAAERAHDAELGLDS